MILTDIRDTDAVLDTAFEFDEPTPGMIFFNPEHGIEAVSGYIGFIPDPDNPWYDTDESAEGEMMMENLDFMLRFWKESYYYPGGTRSF